MMLGHLGVSIKLFTFLDDENAFPGFEYVE